MPIVLARTCFGPTPQRTSPSDTLVDVIGADDHRDFSAAGGDRDCFSAAHRRDPQASSRPAICSGDQYRVTP